jgi:hypothetical protein
MEACYGGTDVMERLCAVARGIGISNLALCLLSYISYNILVFVGSLWPCGPFRSPLVFPPVLLVLLASPVCPPVLLVLVSLSTPPCVLRCPWCLLGPAVV